MAQMKPAAFKDGDKVQYLGDREASRGDGFNPKYVPLIWPNMIATITETKPPEKGMGLVIVDGDTINDEDCDGYNVYTNEHGIGQIIWPKNKKEWELIKS